jgi:hypothetical protein
MKNLLLVLLVLAGSLEPLRCGDNDTLAPAVPTAPPATFVGDVEPIDPALIALNNPNMAPYVAPAAEAAPAASVSLVEDLDVAPAPVAHALVTAPAHAETVYVPNHSAMQLETELVLTLLMTKFATHIVTKDPALAIQLMRLFQDQEYEPILQKVFARWVMDIQLGKEFNIPDSGSDNEETTEDEELLETAAPGLCANLKKALCCCLGATARGTRRGLGCVARGTVKGAYHTTRVVVSAVWQYVAHKLGKYFVTAMIKGVLPGLAMYGVLKHPESMFSVASYLPGLVVGTLNSTVTVGGMLFNLFAGNGIEQ